MLHRLFALQNYFYLLGFIESVILLRPIVLCRVLMRIIYTTVFSLLIPW